MTATILWAAVVANYAADDLISLTNPRNRAATAISTATGENAAQAVIDLWPAYSEEEFDATDTQHLTVGQMGVIAILWQRGGSSASIEKIKWEEVFGPDGVISKVRRTGARGRSGPSSNSNVSTSTEGQAGTPVRGWSDPASLPVGFLPSIRSANGD